MADGKLMTKDANGQMVEVAMVDKAIASKAMADKAMVGNEAIMAGSYALIEIQILLNLAGCHITL